MKRVIAVIAATSFAALAHSAFADESYAPPEVNNTERSLPEFVAQPEQIEDTESAAGGDSAPSEGASAGAETDSESPREIDQ